MGLIIENLLKDYNINNSQCSYPRFIQIISIDCCDCGHSFKSYETELLIEKSRKYFNIEKTEYENECYAEKWNCKKCGSEYMLLWSDFSVALERTTLKPIKINVKQIGRNVKKPIPLFKGLVGYSFPPKSEIESVNYEKFKRYILEIE